LPPIVPEKPPGREVMRREESEDIGGHGVVDVWGGRGRVPAVAEVTRVHGTRKIVRENIIERVPVVIRVADAETLRYEERE
jgi:hypothetical protein